MNTQTQKYVLGALLGVLVLITLWNWSSSPAGGGGLFVGSTRTDRFIVANPTLRLDLLEKISKLDYEGKYKDIFSYSLEKVELPRETAQTPVQPIQPVKPPEPEVLKPPFKFYGFVVDGRTGKKRGFFTNGEDIWVAAEGDTIQTRFRLLKLNNTNAEVEEIATGRRATLPFEESATPSGM